MTLNKILCIGGADIDWTGLYPADFFPIEGVPIEFKKTFGGVAHNIAQNLKSLGCKVEFMSAVGDDSIGSEFVEIVKTTGISGDYVIKLEGQQTASVIFVVGNKGKVLLSSPRTEIYDSFTSSNFIPKLSGMKEFGTWIIDTDLCEEAIEYIAKVKPNETKLYGVIACPSKSTRVNSILNDLDGLFLNADEVSFMVREEIKTDEQILKTAKTLKQQGVKNVFITLGERGVCVVSEAFQGFIPAYKVESRDTKGAGDAFATGVIAGLIDQMSIEASVQQGLAAGSLAVEFEGQTYGMLSCEKLKKRRELNE
jgi:pseudouridine kinase